MPNAAPRRSIAIAVLDGTLALLVLNDSWLKASGELPGWITGKLSDFAGLIVAPVALAVLLRPWPRLVRAAFCTTATVFLAINVSPTCSTWLIDLLGMIGVSWQLTPDPITGNLRSFTTTGMFFVPVGANGAPMASSLGNGNLGRNTLRAAAVFNWDFSVAKRFGMFGSRGLTLRADIFNVFNQDNYGIPINAMNDLSFGQNVNNWGNRSVTLSAKYEF